MFGLLRAIGTFAALAGLRALLLHQLTSDRVGRYTINLTGNFRLIVEPIIEDSSHIVRAEDYPGN